jgi:stage V sporulation protein AC
MTNSQYKKYVQSHAKPSPVIKNTLAAFAVGGTVCAVGQGLLYLYLHLTADEKLSYTLVSVTLVGIAVALTALDLYDGMAKLGGAGTLVPITGFANAVVSPAIDSKAEGYVLGVGAKLFTVAGPVILYGTVASVVYGVIYAVRTLYLGL